MAKEIVYKVVISVTLCAGKPVGKPQEHDADAGSFATKQCFPPGVVCSSL